MIFTGPMILLMFAELSDLAFDNPGRRMSLPGPRLSRTRSRSGAISSGGRSKSPAHSRARSPKAVKSPRPGPPEPEPGVVALDAFSRNCAARPPPELLALMVIVPTASVWSLSRACDSIDGCVAKFAPNTAVLESRFVSRWWLGVIRIGMSCFVLDTVRFFFKDKVGVMAKPLYLPDSKLEYTGLYRMVGLRRRGTFTTQTWLLLGGYMLVAGIAGIAAGDGQTAALPPWFELMLLGAFNVVFPSSVLVSAVVTYVLAPKAINTSNHHNCAMLSSFYGLMMHCANCAMVFVDLALATPNRRVSFELAGLAAMWGVHFVQFSWRWLSREGVCFYYFLDPTLPLKQSIPCHLGLLALVVAAAALGGLVADFTAELDFGESL